MFETFLHLYFHYLKHFIAYIGKKKCFRKAKNVSETVHETNAPLSYSRGAYIVNK